MSAPPISDPELLARLALSDPEFERYVLELAARMPPRPFGPEQLLRALGYPWERPQGSFRLASGRAEPLATMAPAERERALAMRERDERTPLLATGSNAAPSALALKLADLEHERDRELLGLPGRLCEVDIAAAAQPALYGSLPATPFPSPGTAVAATLLWVTPAQLTRLAWTELNYRLGRLRARFEVEETGEAHEDVAIFVSRFGCFAPDGEPLALAAVPAEGRRAAALSQADLLDRAAAVVLGDGAGAEALVRTVLEDWGGVAPRVAAMLWRTGVRFDIPDWRG